MIFTNSNILAGPGFASANGIYSYSYKNQKLTTIAQTGLGDFNPPLPGGYAFQETYSDSANTVFRALGPDTSTSSIYVSSNKYINTKIFGSGDPLPNNRGDASYIFQPRIRGDDVLFTAVGDDGRGRVYRTDLTGSSVSTFLDLAPPGSDDIDFYALGGFEDGYLAYRTRRLPDGRYTGVYTADMNGAVNTIARLGDPLPGAPGQTIGLFSGDTLHPSISDGKVVYAANGTGNTDGIYIAPVTGGASEVVVDDTMFLPGDTGITAGFALASISGDNVSFLGVTAAGTTTGLWVSMAGELVKIAYRNEVFDGRIVDDVFASPFSMYDNTVAFEIVFTDNTRGLYLATIIPAPGGVVVFGLAGAWAVRRRRKALMSV